MWASCLDIRRAHCSPLTTWWEVRQTTTIKSSITWSAQKQQLSIRKGVIQSGPKQHKGRTTSREEQRGVQQQEGQDKQGLPASNRRWRRSPARGDSGGQDTQHWGSSPVVRTLHSLPMQEAQIQSLVREQRFCMPSAVKRKKNTQGHDPSCYKPCEQTQKLHSLTLHSWEKSTST